MAEDKIEDRVELKPGEELPSPKALNEGEVDAGQQPAVDAKDSAEKPTAKPALTSEEISAKLLEAERIAKENSHLKSRIGKLTGQKKQLEEGLAAKSVTGEAKPAASDQEAFRKAVDEAAEAKSAQAKFDDDCRAAVDRGKKLFDDFQPKITQLWEDCGKDDPVKYSAFVAGVLETGIGEKILYELAQDPMEATRLLGLSPVKQGMELAKLANKLNEVQPLSNAPKPIPVLRGVTHEAIDPRDPERASKLATRTWMERRQAQVDEAWAKDHPKRRA